MGLHHMTDKQQPVTARLIIEMIGSPKEHVTQTITKYIEKLKKDGLPISKETIAPTEPKGELWATHTQFEAMFLDAADLIAFCFDAMPSSVEILTPDKLTLGQKDFENLINDLQARLHTVDLELKKTRAENKVLDRNALAVFRNFILHCVKHGEDTDKAIAKSMGITTETLPPFTDVLLKEKKLLKENDKYRIPHG